MSVCECVFECVCLRACFLCIHKEAVESTMGKDISHLCVYLRRFLAVFVIIGEQVDVCLCVSVNTLISLELSFSHTRFFLFNAF